MNSRKASLYIFIMLMVPFIGGYLILNVRSSVSEAIWVALVGALYINGFLFFLGFLGEGIKYIRGDYKTNEKVFWMEWVETTFALWILGIIMTGLVQTYIRLR